MIQSPIKRDDFKRLDKDAKQIGRILAAVNPGAFDEMLKEYSLDIGDAIHLVICGLAAVGRVEDAENAYWKLFDIAKYGSGHSLRDSRMLRGHMLKESTEDDVVVFTSLDGKKKWEIPRENLENAKWTYDVDYLDGEMEQIFGTKVKDNNNKDIFVGGDILVDEDDVHYYGEFIIDNKYEVECNVDGYDVDIEDACEDFGVKPKTYNVLKKIYSRRNNLG